MSSVCLYHDVYVGIGLSDFFLEKLICNSELPSLWELLCMFLFSMFQCCICFYLMLSIYILRRCVLYNPVPGRQATMKHT